MTAPSPALLATLLPVLVSAALVLSWLRAGWRWRQLARDARPARWRIALLAVLQVAAAALLALTLLPPERAVDGGTLVVLARDHATVAGDPARLGRVVVALPEAGPAAGALRVPDLGSARRLHPALQRLHVVGDGLPARDRDAVAGAALAFSPSPAATGLVEAWSPPRASAGGSAVFAGRIAGIDGATVELRDPAGRRIARARPAADGRFTLRATLREAGRFGFALQLRDRDGRLLESAVRAVEVVDGRDARVLLLAAAPNAETKFLRRWLADAGLSLRARIALGGGIAIGDAAAAPDAATLAATDLLLVDARSWQALGDGGRARVLAAVADGLGLLLRIDDLPSAALRTQLAALGLTVDARGAGPTRLDAAAPSAVAILTRRAGIAAGDAAVLLRDASGAPLAAWRAHGRGRIAAWALDDSHRLVLAGDGAAHARLWSAAVGTLARDDGAAPPRLPDDAVAGERTVLCGLRPGDSLSLAGGGTAPLAPVAGAHGRCAAVWPSTAGWHALVRDGRTHAFHVDAADALPGVRRRALREATQALVGDDPAPGVAATAPGPRWPWFCAFLVACALLWWLERSRVGRGAAGDPPADAAAPRV